MSEAATARATRPRRPYIGWQKDGGVWYVELIRRYTAYSITSFDNARDAQIAALAAQAVLDAIHRA